ncbi:MAG TPA: S8 family serine peptidase [Longimicrobium sp.]|nr:S8 family serine peptidase [Longimicrobium sp.]
MIQVADVQAAQTAPPEWVRDELGGATGSGILVAVLDSGWDRTIDDPRVLPGVGFVDPDDDFALARNDDDHDVLGHGTACADVILGVAPDARIIPVKVFGNTLETSPGTLQTALEWAIEAGVQVINVSLGTRLEGTLHALYRACERARQAGIIVVAAGHNANDWSYPAIFENVIGVSAARFDSPYHFHYRAEHAMECVGWGVDRPVLWVGGERVVRHGTSFAAPGVAGIVCLILERHPGARIEDVRQMLARFALPGGEDVAPDADAPPAPKRKRATSSAKAAPATSASKTRTRAPASDEAAPAKPAAKPRKRAAAADQPVATKPRKRAAAPVADAAAETAKKPRKRTTAPARTSDTAPPAKTAAKPRKQAAATVDSSPAVADNKRGKRAPAAAKATEDAVPAKPATKLRKRAEASAGADTKPRRK